MSARFHCRCWFKQRLIQETAGCVVRFEQSLDLSPQTKIALASTIEKSGAFVRWFLVNGRQEDFIGSHESLRLRDASRCLSMRGIEPARSTPHRVSLNFFRLRLIR